MATFPDYKPTYQPSKSNSRSGSNAYLGDGYKNSILFGLNSIQTEWQLEWIVDESSSIEIDGFLQTQADNGDHFEWQPPDSTTLLKWKCEEWTIEIQGPDIFVINATFKRVIELSYLQLAPDVASCPSDELCETDTGNWGQWPAWVAKLRGSVVSNRYLAGSASSYTFDNGYIYLVYSLPISQNNFVMYLAKFRGDGVTVWVRKYGNLSTYNMAGGDYYATEGGFQMTADESNNLLFVTWQAERLNDSSSTGRHRVMGFDAVNGIALWESGFTFNAKWTTNCAGRTGPGYGFNKNLSITYDKINNEVHIGGASSEGYGTEGFAAVFSKYGTPIRDHRFTGVARRHESDYLGNSPCKVVQASTGVVGNQNSIFFVTSSVDSSAGGYGYRVYAPAGTLDLCGNLLGNGQACVATNAGTGWDLIIFEDNGVVVDHVKFIARGFIATNNKWPFSNIGPFGISPRIAFNRFVSLRQDIDGQYRLYFQAGTSRGINFAVVDVTVNSSNGKITSIGNYSSYIVTAHDPFTSNVDNYATGGNKFISNIGNSSQITATILPMIGTGFGTVQFGQVALASIKRFGGLNSTGGTWDYFYIGTQVSQTLGSNYYYYVDNSPVTPTRAGLTASVIYDNLNINSGISVVDSSCIINTTSPVFLGYKLQGQAQIITEDVTQSQIFDLYTSSA